MYHRIFADLHLPLEWMGFCWARFKNHSSVVALYYVEPFVAASSKVPGSTAQTYLIERLHFS